MKVKKEVIGVSVLLLALCVGLGVYGVEDTVVEFPDPKPGGCD